MITTICQHLMKFHGITTTREKDFESKIPEMFEWIKRKYQPEESDLMMLLLRMANTLGFGGGSLKKLVALVVMIFG